MLEQARRDPHARRAGVILPRGRGLHTQDNDGRGSARLRAGGGGSGQVDPAAVYFLRGLSRVLRDRRWRPAERRFERVRERPVPTPRMGRGRRGASSSRAPTAHLRLGRARVTTAASPSRRRERRRQRAPSASATRRRPRDAPRRRRRHVRAVAGCANAQHRSTHARLRVLTEDCSSSSTSSASRITGRARSCRGTSAHRPGSALLRHLRLLLPPDR